jgi:hypothetical protein
MNKRESVMDKVREIWTERQLDIWEDITRKYNKRVDGKVNLDSMLNNAGMIFKDEEFDADFVRAFHDNYISNLQAMMNVYDYKYVKVSDENLQDMRDGISFDGQGFTLDSMKLDLLSNGMYEPLFADIKRDDYIRVSCGRHRLIALRSLYEDGLWDDSKSILCIFFDSYIKDFNYSMVAPTILIDIFFDNYNLKLEKVDDRFSRIYISNPVDSWIIYKLQEKEFNFILEKHMDLLLKHGIKSSSVINK